MDFDEMMDREPLLRELLYHCRGANKAKDPKFCCMAAWYGEGGRVSLKRLMCELVGLNRRSENYPELATIDAYDVAYQSLFNALPQCGLKCTCRKGT